MKTFHFRQIEIGVDKSRKARAKIILFVESHTSGEEIFSAVKWLDRQINRRRKRYKRTDKPK